MLRFFCISFSSLFLFLFLKPFRFSLCSPSFYEKGVNPSGWTVLNEDAPLSGACHVLWGPTGTP